MGTSFQCHLHGTDFQCALFGALIFSTTFFSDADFQYLNLAGTDFQYQVFLALIFSTMYILCDTDTLQQAYIAWH